MPLGLDGKEEQQLDVLDDEKQEDGGGRAKPPSNRKWFIDATEGLGLTAADVEHVCRESAMEALREDIDCNTVSRRHFKRSV